MIVRQQFMSHIQVNILRKPTPLLCQVKVAVIKLRYHHGKWHLFISLSCILTLQFLFHPVNSYHQRKIPEFLPSLRIDAWSPLLLPWLHFTHMSPSSLQLCSFQSSGSDVSSTTSSPACWVQHLSTFKTISLHGTDDWERCIISSPVVNKSGYDDIHVSVIKSQCPLVGHVDRYMPVIKSSNSLLIMYKTAFVILSW